MNISNNNQPAPTWSLARNQQSQSQDDEEYDNDDDNPLRLPRNYHNHSATSSSWYDKQDSWAHLVTLDEQIC